MTRIFLFLAYFGADGLPIVKVQYVILAYDVRQKRVQKVMKICRKYLNHLQNSVFEGNISEAKLKKLKDELQRCIDTASDSICIFKLESTRYVTKEQIGIIPIYEHII